MIRDDKMAEQQNSNVEEKWQRSEDWKKPAALAISECNTNESIKKA